MFLTRNVTAEIFWMFTADLMGATEKLDWSERLRIVIANVEEQILTANQ